MVTVLSTPIQEKKPRVTGEKFELALTMTSPVSFTVPQSPEQEAVGVVLAGTPEAMTASFIPDVSEGLRMP